MVHACLCSKVTYPKIPNKGRISNKVRATIRGLNFLAGFSLLPYYPKIPNKGRTSNNMCAPLFWRKKMNWKIKGAHQIKSARTLFEMRPLIGTLGCAL